MSASDSDLSEVSKTPAPPDHELEKALRREVVKAQRDAVDFSYKYIRTKAEEELGLIPGFYKTTDDWNARSKAIIAEQTVRSPTFAHFTLSGLLKEWSGHESGRSNPACEELFFWNLTTSNPFLHHI